MEGKLCCQICGNPDARYHYTVLSCDGCGAFFKRGVKQNINYTCQFSGNCTTLASTSYHEARCKACRFWKCVSLGMRPDPKSSSRLRCSQKEVPGVERALTSSRRRTAFDRSPNLISGGYLSYTGSDLNPDLKHVPSTEFQLVPNWLPDLTSHIQFFPILNFFPTSVDNKAQLLSSIVHAVGAIVDIVFGDQIANWARCRDQALQHGYVVDQPETSMEKFVLAINEYNNDLLLRIHKFAELLPGIGELAPKTRGCTRAAWKYMIYWMIHHAPFMTNVEAYITIGHEQYHYCRYWQDRISKWPVIIFAYKFCTAFREIGLDQTEQYLLMAVVMFEPVKETPSDERLDQLHRHYTDALLDMIKRRCSDKEHLTAVCRKLERLLSSMKTAYLMWHSYYGTTWQQWHQSPLATRQAQARIIQLQADEI